MELGSLGILLKEINTIQELKEYLCKQRGIREEKINRLINLGKEIIEASKKETMQLMEQKL